MTSKKNHTVTRADGQQVKVTVPDDATPDAVLADAISECISPYAVAAIAANLEGMVVLGEEPVSREVEWFQKYLVEMLGAAEYQKLAAELHL